MEATHPIFFLISLLNVVLCLKFAARYFACLKLTKSIKKFPCIDGLRGYMAFFVFLHHSCIWFYYLQTGKWQVPPSRLFTHLGQSSVAIFFMITSFLFSKKMLDTRDQHKSIDWNRLYLHRFWRLVPLYLFVFFLIVLIVLIRTDFKLRESTDNFATNLFHWLFFTMFKQPDINLFNNTKFIVAGVTWSLPYEWIFYFSLPIMGLFLNVSNSKFYNVLSLCTVVLFFAFVRVEKYHLFNFGAGIISAMLVSNKKTRLLSNHRLSSVIVYVSILMLLFLFSNTFTPVATLLLFLIFHIIVSGNSLNGILLKDFSIYLGEIAYSIYLLHGIVLFIPFIFFLRNTILLNSPLLFWGIIQFLIPILITISLFTFKFIEKPGMNFMKRHENYVSVL